LTGRAWAPYGVPVPLRSGLASALLGLALLLAPASLTAQTPSAPPAAQPFAPDWRMLAGWDVFTSKGCGRCHALRGTGPVTGPDLGRVGSERSFFDVGAALWNHLPRMGEQMRAGGVERPRLTPREMNDLIAFIFTAQYFDAGGDVRLGERVFTSKGCVQCHAIGGKGGQVGPALDVLKRANSPVLVAAAMWNHGPKMTETMRAKGIPRPTLRDKEMLDLIAYVVSAASEPGGDTAQVVPGTPGRGEQIFAERRCAGCHAVGGKGPSVGPDLGRSGHHVSLTAFAARMWNHGPAMWAKMKERGIEVPQLSGQEMADILAYLYTAHYFEQRGNVGRGQKLVRERGCTSCHSVRGKGVTAAADFATSTVVGTPASVIAAMWNHAGLMEAKSEKTKVALPQLTGQELADISAYLASLAKSK
jgi:mono/diheme cytochrome c family protein